ncbi:hypothetical protein PPL_10302 [Heterostelium album PN500]|uniref:Uncharacterized protein n=1 Tax=Heterostelium pallidum (strain ATCC 26659 / Pp 5 / PN500) TaxID=670386 RepID=D3BPY3_HETP5|nr:hypothetical protein PPL_10302 [Heterostelium album PN500]EFA76534.1 hypothetical protein PPL_10302 [Heterostelium album PN500]|eukprot:XP_020428666.1 hypothetical protein PPL_10302 [Heterostelium album PN500]
MVMLAEIDENNLKLKSIELQQQSNEQLKIVSATAMSKKKTTTTKTTVHSKLNTLALMKKLSEKCQILDDEGSTTIDLTNTNFGPYG